MKKVTIYDFLTLDQVKKAREIFDGCTTPGKAGVHKLLLDEVIQPNIAEINHKLGQENDARYLAFAVEYVLVQAAAGISNDNIKVMG